jgi:BlaI family penicillinase repressor
MATKARISEGEWIIMQALWTSAPLTAEQVVKAVESKVAWKEATIKTMLNRLVRKGVLRFEMQGKRYLYRPAVSRETCVRGESRLFANRIFGGVMGAMIAHFVERSHLTPEEISQLRQLLDKKTR